VTERRKGKGIGKKKQTQHIILENDWRDNHIKGHRDLND
jgi:hypothetical protein